MWLHHFLHLLKMEVICLLSCHGICKTLFLFACTGILHRDILRRKSTYIHIENVQSKIVELESYNSKKPHPCLNFLCQTKYSFGVKQMSHYYDYYYSWLYVYAPSNLNGVLQIHIIVIRSNILWIISIYLLKRGV